MPKVSRELVLSISTPIPQHHWDKLVAAIRAVAVIDIMDDYVEVTDIDRE